MGYDHNTVAGQRQVQLDRVTVCLDGTSECRQGVLGVFALEASMGNYLRRIGGWMVSGVRLVGLIIVYLLVESGDGFSCDRGFF